MSGNGTTAAVRDLSRFIAGIHMARDIRALRSAAQSVLEQLLPNSSAAVVLHRGDQADVEVAVGSECPLDVDATVSRAEAWPGAASTPLRYGDACVGELLHDAEHDDSALHDLLGELVDHLTIALVNLKLNAEALRTTEHYCASLQAFEEGVVLFQERDEEAVGARFLALLNSLMGTQIGALLVLDRIGDPNSSLKLQQAQGMPDHIIEELKTPDGEWWPPQVATHPADILERDPTTGDFADLCGENLPPAMNNVVHCALRYHGICVGVALAFNVSASETELALKVERARRLCELGAAIFHRLSLERSALKSREMETQLSIAASIQSRLIPADPPRSTAINCAWRSEPAQFVGGDYIDLLDSDGGDVHAIVADVSGHGINSALLMASCRAAYRAECSRLPPDELLAWLNNEVSLEVGDTGMFITAAALCFSPDGRSMTYASAGHNPLFLFRAADGSIETLDSTGPSLGMFAGMSYDRCEVELNVGDILLLYTDGIVEATNSNEEMFDDERLMNVLKEHSDADATSILAAVQRELDEFIGPCKCDDDVSISIIKIV